MFASTTDPPRWMRVSAACAFGATILLALTVYALVWSGLAEGTASPFGRERLPVLDAGEDLAWLPSPAWIVFWLALVACVVVTIRLERGREDRFEPWYQFKERINKCRGLQFNIDESMLYQVATDSLGETEAASGLVRFYGQWEPFRDCMNNPGQIVFKAENRH